ncbi:MAG: ATPase [Salinarimonas sp.]|nr:ATPase [Salinarimonas sp.]
MTRNILDDIAPVPGEGSGNSHGPQSAAPADPGAAARLSMQAHLPKRFYEKAALAEAEGGFVLTLDGRPARSPGKNPLRLPSRAAGAAVVAEWEAQGTHIDPAGMPITRIANSAIDGVALQMDAVREEVAKYAASDLVCYRAEEPESLVAAQNAAWDPVLAHFRERHDAHFVLAAGVMYVEQPPQALERIAALVDAHDCPYRVAALHVMTTLTGSALISLAASAEALSSETAWDAAHVDERVQESFWGTDDEALARRARRQVDFDAALTLYRLADTG